MLAQVGNRSLGSALEAEGRYESALFVHQIDDRGVIHCIAALLKRYLLENGTIRLGDRGDIIKITGEPGKMRVKAGEIVLEHGRGVALRIDGNEQRTDTIGIRTDATDRPP